MLQSERLNQIIDRGAPDRGAGISGRCAAGPGGDPVPGHPVVADALPGGLRRADHGLQRRRTEYAQPAWSLFQDNSLVLTIPTGQSQWGGCAERGADPGRPGRQPGPGKRCRWWCAASRMARRKPVSVTLQSFPASARTIYFVIPYIVGVLFLGISLWIFGMRRSGVGRAGLCAVRHFGGNRQRRTVRPVYHAPVIAAVDAGAGLRGRRDG